MEQGGKRKGDPEDIEEITDDEYQEADRNRSNPNSEYYDNGTGNWPWERTKEERDEADPSNPNSPNYEG